MISYQKSMDGGATWHEVVPENETPVMMEFLNYILGQDGTAAVVIHYIGRSVTFRAAP
jgi:hypothetical protein